MAARAAAAAVAALAAVVYEQREGVGREGRVVLKEEGVRADGRLPLVFGAPLQVEDGEHLCNVCVCTHIRPYVRALNIYHVHT